MSIDAMKLALEALETDFVMPSEQWKAEDEAIKVLRAAIEQAEKPVAWWHDMGDVVDLNVSGRGTPLYTAPPQREWQGLTDEEIKHIAAYGHQVAAYAWTGNFARAIEAKLKEKNT